MKKENNIEDKSNDKDTLVSKRLSQRRRERRLELEAGQGKPRMKSRDKPDEIDGLVGRRLKEKRLQLGLTQEDVASHINVCKNQVMKYEKHQDRVAAGKLYSISQLLRVPINYFFERKTDDDPK